MVNHETKADGPGEVTQRPLVTFALFAYNQEKYIREAVEGALAQNYSPLEIILSDDCSTDGTFEIMKELTAAYSGQHRVVLVRNVQNEGIGAHINSIMKIAKGDLIVGAAGDDISLPTRVEKLVGEWIRCDKRAFSLYSGAIEIDAAGKELRITDPRPKEMQPIATILSLMDGVQGCSHAWSREVYSVFGPILPDTVFEDRVIPLRSMLLGGIAYFPEPLVKYRIHGANISHHFATSADQILARTISIHVRNLNVAENYIRDLQLASGHPFLSRTPWLPDALKSVLEMRRVLADKVQFHSGSRIVKCGMILKYLLNNPTQAIKWLLILLRPQMYVNNQRRNLGIREELPSSKV